MSFENLKEILQSWRVSDWEEVDDGIVCNYHDGFDYVLLREAPAHPEIWVTGFLRTDGRRQRFIDGVRLSAKRSNITLTVSSNGEAYYEAGSVSGEFDLGRELTVLLEKHDVLEGLEEFREKVWFDIKSEDFRDERDLGSVEVADTEENGPTTPDVLGTVISAAFHVINLVDTDDIVDAVKNRDFSAMIAKYPELELLKRLIQKYGDRFEVDLIGPQFCIRFDDGGRYALEHDIILKANLSQFGIDRVFEQVCEQYEKANRRRSECRHILFSHMAALGYYLDESESRYAFGKSHRKFFFDPERELTDNDAKGVVVSWLRQQGLPANLDTDAATPIETRPLPDFPPRLVPVLKGYNLAHLDDKAKAILEEFWCVGPEVPHKFWGNPLTYQRNKDGWLDRDWWHEQAKIHDDDFLLAIFGDRSAYERIVDIMKGLAASDCSATFAIYEGFSPVQTYMARQHAWPEEDPAVFYAYRDTYCAADDYWLSYFGTLPYEIKKYAQGCVRDGLRALDDSMLGNIERSLRVFRVGEIGSFFADDQIEEIHRYCLAKAAGQFAQYSGEDSFLRLSHMFGWNDVVPALGNNESFWQLWETWPNNLVVSGTFSLALSLFDCDHVTQRLSAWTLLFDERDDLFQNDSDQYWQHFLAEQQMKSALAWSRTRKLF